MRSCALPSRSSSLSATTYSVNGAGSFTYTAGDNIDVNGWRVQISGAPAVGDSFTVSDNTAGTGDNRNALRWRTRSSAPVLNGGTTSLGSRRRRVRRRHRRRHAPGAGQSRRQKRRPRGKPRAKEAVSGVNLDEEAANCCVPAGLPAAAQIIRVADTMFQTLLAATER